MITSNLFVCSASNAGSDEWLELKQTASAETVSSLGINEASREIEDSLRQMALESEQEFNSSVTEQVA